MRDFRVLLRIMSASRLGLPPELTETICEQDVSIIINLRQTCREMEGKTRRPLEVYWFSEVPVIVHPDSIQKLLQISLSTRLNHAVSEITFCTNNRAMYDGAKMSPRQCDSLYSGAFQALFSLILSSFPNCSWIIMGNTPEYLEWPKCSQDPEAVPFLQDSDEEALNTDISSVVLGVCCAIQS
jgi:hypothetical protein